MYNISINHPETGEVILFNTIFDSYLNSWRAGIINKKRIYSHLLKAVLIHSIMFLFTLLFTTIIFAQQPYRLEKEISDFTQKFNLSDKLQPDERLDDFQATIDIIAKERARLFERKVLEEDYRVATFIFCIRLPNDPPKPPKTEQAAIKFRSRIIKGVFTNKFKQEAIVKAINPNILKLGSGDISSKQLTINDLLDISKVN